MFNQRAPIFLQSSLTPASDIRFTMMTEEPESALPTPQDHALFNPPKDVSNLAMAICIFAIFPYFIVLPLTLSTIPKTEHKGLIAVGAVVVILHLVYLFVLCIGLKSFKRKSNTAQKMTMLQGLDQGCSTTDGTTHNNDTNALAVPMEGLASTGTRLQKKLDDITTLQQSLIYLICFTVLMSAGWAVLLVYSLEAKAIIIKDAALAGSSIVNGNNTALEDREGGAQELVWICGVQCVIMLLIMGLLIWEMLKLRKYTRVTIVAKDVASYFV